MQRKLTIWCPPMAVRNTGWWWKIFADRRTDALICEGEIEGVCKLQITFPPCRVFNITPGRWMVDPVIAKGHLDSGEYLQISYPTEPVIREGKLMVAQPVESIDTESYVYLHRSAHESIERCQVKSILPRAESSPVGLGARQYVVEAVTLPGSVEWPT